MSVVAVAVDPKRITIGADGFIGEAYDMQIKDKDAKLFAQNGMVIGVVGWLTDVGLFRIYSRTRKPSAPTEIAMIEFFSEFIEWARKRQDNYCCSSEFLIVFQGRVFNLYGMYCKEIKEYDAIGAGQHIAKTALFLGEDVRGAVEVACELSVWCERPITVLTVDRKQDKS